MQKTNHFVREIVYYENGDVKVTNKRIVIGDNTYFVSNINAVGKFVIQPNRFFSILMMVVGMLGFLSGVFIEPNDCTGISLLIAIAGLVFFLMQKPKYVVRINGSSGDISILRSKEENFVQEIVDAINQAIIS